MPSDKFFTFSQLSHMQKVLSVLVMSTLMFITPTFAADLPGTPATDATPTTTSEVAPVEAAAPDMILNAAPAVVASMGSSLGEYQSVACSVDPAFATNSCDQCFVGGSVKVGEGINGMFDNWINNTTNMLIAYQDEQKLPNMVPFSSVWTPSPIDTTKFWKSSAEVMWTQVGAADNRMNSILAPGQKVRFNETELGANYKLESSEKKDGEMIGLLRFPIVAHVLDTTTGNEGAATTHYQCVSYTLAAPAPVVTPTPVTPTPVAPAPGEVTQTATGPAETLILILAAFFIAFGMMFSLRKQS